MTVSNRPRQQSHSQPSLLPPIKNNLSPSVTPITDYWISHPEYWFHSTPETDRKIYEHYSSVRFPSPPPGFENYPIPGSSSTLPAIPIVPGLDLPLEKIIWYDQIYRHLCRYHGSPYPDWARNYALQCALPIIDLPHTNLLPPEYQCFIWLTLRHSNNPTLLQKALEWSYKRHTQNPQVAIYRRFYYATVKRITLDANRRFEKSVCAAHSFLAVTSDNDTSPPDSQSSCRHHTQTTLLDWGDLLDPDSTYHPQDSPPDKSHLPYTLSRNSSSTEREEEDSASKAATTASIHEVIRAWQSSYPRVVSRRTPLIISLSGGVDSMVCLYLATRFGHPVHALMINYDNRDDSQREQTLVQNWCDYLGVPLHVRVINEINRSRLDREFYESHTREIRFWCYKTLRSSLTHPSTHSSTPPDIILGHNYDDTKENALNNIRKNIHLDNLAKMRSLETLDDSGITLSRPFLEIPKKTLLDVAHYFNLPYFVDSTPKWSERGRLRDSVIPTLENYDPSIFQSLFNFSQRFAT